ncbi:MAG: DUF4440 domain-containing protein [Nitrospira sp.]|nr:DUF4440 domain-containing protein [Nitrospira sp.]MCP9465214.1 DUF4440 domain-containing protein [Nitrospira sp.]
MDHCHRPTGKENGQPTPKPNDSSGRVRTTVVIGLGAMVLIAVGISFVPRLQNGGGWPVASSRAVRSSQGPLPATPPSPSQPESPLTTESIEALLADLDQAVQRKDVEAVLRLIAPDAVIVIRMKQGPHHQTALLTREDYRKALAAEFAFPSANDFSRSHTTVSPASDERSAKISFKTTETLRHAEREFTVEGEQTLIVTMRGDKPVIVSLERDVPGDPT